MSATIVRLAAWPFTPGASYAEGGFKIALYSMALALFYLFAAEWQLPGGANHFTMYAKALVEGGSLPEAASRDIGYPLLLLLGGYGVTQSFIGVMAVHVLLAWSIPVIAYATFGREYRHLGFYTAAVVALSMTPYLYLKFIHHDLAYITLSVLSACLMVEYLHRGRIAVLYWFLAALVATCLTRPAGNILFLPLLALLWAFRPAHWRHYLMIAAIFAAVLAAYAAHRDQLLGRTPGGERPSYFGQQVFFNLYVNSADYGVRITPAIGPATARLFDTVRQTLKKHPLDSQYMTDWYRGHGFTQSAREFWFTRYLGQEERFIAALFEHPSYDTFEYLCLVATSDELLRDVAFEIARAHPLYPIQYGLRNLAIFLWNPGVTHGRFGVEYKSFARENLYFLPGGRSVAEVEAELVIEPPGRYELRQSGSKMLLRPLKKVEKKWKSLYHGVNKAAVSLAAAALVASFVVGGRFRLIVTVTAAFLLYNAAITAAFVEPNYRYHFLVFPMVLILAGAGAIALLRTLARLRGAFPVLARTLNRFNAWAVEAAPDPGSARIGWKKPVGLALGSAAVFSAWAFNTWSAAHQ